MPDRAYSDEVLAAVLFAGIGDDDKQRMLDAAVLREYVREQMLFTQGQPADTFFLVDSGSVKLIQSTPEGKEMIVRFIRPGEVIAAVALLPGGRFPVTAIASEASRVAAWSSERMRDFVQAHPSLHANIMSAMAMHMQDALSQGRELATSRVPQRLAAMLLRLADRGGSDVPDGVLVEQALSREEMAEMIGTTLFTVSRILSEWQDAGIVSTRRQHVVLHDRDRLSELAGQQSP
ncbi:MAG: Crp/Fnr family transcriptional regulator [Gammaproteobacteria bacterium]